MKFASPILFAFASTLAACSSSSDGTGSDPNGEAKSATNVCGLNSGFPGDELCILPPDPSEGIQLHVGPASYDDPEALAPYLLDVGGEDVKCFNTALPENSFHYLKQKNRMRSGSHHMLIGLENGSGLQEGPTDQCDVLGSAGSIPGSQTPEKDFPDQLAPEDQGLARWLPDAQMAQFQLHYVNTGKEPVLREAWVNIYKADESQVTQSLQNVFMVGDFGVNVPPNTRQTTTLDFSPNLPGPIRVFTLNGHSHAHAESFTLWRIHGDQRELIYQSFDWAEPKVLTFNTVTTNAPPDPVAKVDGGHSGLLYFEPGDKLEWACDVNNTTNAALHFANEAHTAEMCLLAGAYISDTGGLMTGGCINGQCAAGFAPPTG